MKVEKQTCAECVSCPAVGDLLKEGLEQVIPAHEHLWFGVTASKCLFSALGNVQLQQLSLTWSTWRV